MGATTDVSLGATIRTLLGGSAPDTLSSEYATYVSKSSGAEISISEFFNLATPAIGAAWSGLPTYSSYNTNNSQAGAVADSSFYSATEARIQFHRGGYWSERANYVDSGAYTNYDWNTWPYDTVGDSYYVKWDHVSGDTVSYSTGFTEATYHAISSTRALAIASSGSLSEKTALVDITLATSSGGAGASIKRVYLYVYTNLL
jgi:hypothetical protein